MSYQYITLPDCKTPSAWLCLLLLEVVSARSLHQQMKFDWEKHLDSHTSEVGREGEL